MKVIRTSYYHIIKQIPQIIIYYIVYYNIVKLQWDYQPFFILLFSGIRSRNEKVFPFQLFHCSIHSFSVAPSRMKKVDPLFFSLYSILGQPGDCPQNDTLLASLSWIIAHFFFDPIHYSRPASGRMKKCFSFHFFHSLFIHSRRPRAE